MVVEIFVFGSKEGLFDIRRKGVDVNKGTIFFLIDFVKKISMTIEDLSGELRWLFDKISGMRQLVKNLKVGKNGKKGKSEKNN